LAIPILWISVEMYVRTKSSCSQRRQVIGAILGWAVLLCIGLFVGYALYSPWSGVWVDVATEELK
jgi:hypothetical protein